MTRFAVPPRLNHASPVSGAERDRLPNETEIAWQSRMASEQLLHMKAMLDDAQSQYEARQAHYFKTISNPPPVLGQPKWPDASVQSIERGLNSSSLSWSAKVVEESPASKPIKSTAPAESPSRSDQAVPFAKQEGPHHQASPHGASQELEQDKKRDTNRQEMETRGNDGGTTDRDLKPHESPIPVKRQRRQIQGVSQGSSFDKAQTGNSAKDLPDQKMPLPTQTERRDGRRKNIVTRYAARLKNNHDLDAETLDRLAGFADTDRKTLMGAVVFIEGLPDASSLRRMAGIRDDLAAANDVELAQLIDELDKKIAARKVVTNLPTPAESKTDAHPVAPAKPDQAEGAYPVRTYRKDRPLCGLL